ncbi:MAG: hypothetical protein ACE14V_10035 [bacterium]
MNKNKGFIILLIIFCIYAGLFIYRTSFEIYGTRYFSLFDDAMVSMRYAHNLVQGFGLVWNPGSGDRIEGYTNPLWVLYMALFHLMPIPASKISLYIQLSGLVFLLFNLIYVKKIAGLISSESQPVILGAVALTAFYLPLNTWALQGMEVSILTLLTTIAVWLALKSISDTRFSGRLYLLLGFSTLIRIDMVIIYIAILVYLIYAIPAQRKYNLFAGIAGLIFFLAIQILFRYWYYGELLPNTYYLKMTGYPILLRITRGVYVALSFIYNLNFILFLLPLLIFWIKKNEGYPKSSILLLFWLLIAEFGYSIYVGGDAWDNWGGSNRYISLVMPGYFILFTYTIAELAKYLCAKLVQQEEFRSRYTSQGILILVIIALLNFNAIYGPGALAQWLLIKRPLNTHANHEMIRLSYWIKKNTTPEAKIAIVWAGTVPYFADRYCIDMLGKNDKVIAHEPGHVSSSLSRYIEFHPGHMKWDYRYSIGQLQPDIVVQLWGNPESAKPILDTQYQPLDLGWFKPYLRTGSPNIIWGTLK